MYMLKCRFVTIGQIQVSNNGTKSILDMITKMNPNLGQLINITELLPYLIKYGILTKDEREKLELECKTNRKKIQDLLSLLNYKGEVGHTNFIIAIYESSKIQGNSGHCEIIELFKSEGISIIESKE